MIWGGVACVIGTLALGACLPRFVRYDGRDGLKHKEAEEAVRAEAVAATAAA